MALPRFSAGQRVSLSHARAPLAPGSVYKIVRALPAEGRPVQYRVKSDGESFERIVDEARLEVISHD